MRLLENSWSEMLILDQIHQRMHNHLPDETTLANGQKFELLSLALLGVPSMSEAFNDMTSKLSNLKFDSADYVCLKFVLLLNPGAKKALSFYTGIPILLPSERVCSRCMQLAHYYYILGFVGRGILHKRCIAKIKTLMR